jgi:transketolase
MLNASLHLLEGLLEAKEQAATRDGLGKGLVELGTSDPRVVALCADLSESTRMQEFQKAFPARFIEVGVAEQNLATLGSGLANYGKLPYIASYAAFSPGRNWEQIRTTIALADLPVIICGMHAGVSVGPDGATHQPLEDVALMRVMPNMTVIVPCDAEEARKATIAVSKLGKPAYLRMGREKTPLMTTTETPFEIGQANVLWEAGEGITPQVTIVGMGALVHAALVAADRLSHENIAVSVINMHTIKPLDSATLIAHARAAGAVVTIEEHQINGGLGGAVAEALAKEHPVPQEFVAVHDMFGQSGTPDELLKHYHLTADDVVEAVKRVIGRKG